MDITLKSRLWASDGTNYVFPEQCMDSIMSRPAIGACFSGGGTRAMTCAMGQLRAMTELGVIPTLRYISCVSGGSWASTIYTYYQSGASNDQDLLGPITRADQITDAHVAAGLTTSQLAYGATRSLEDIVASWEFYPDWEYSSHDVWNFAVGETFLEPFGLFDKSQAASHPDKLASYTLDQATLDEIRKCNPDLVNHPFFLPRPDRPFLIINSCFLLPESDPVQSELRNFEYTPLTVGRPFKSTFQGKDFGGGFIEPFAFRGLQPSAPPDPNGCAGRRLNSLGWVTVQNQDRPMTLVDATGTSSSAFAEEAISQYDTGRFDPRAEYWAIDGSGPYPAAAKTLFGDGGLLENNGIIPLIQRGVQLAIVFINTETKLDPDYRPSSDRHDPANDPNGRCDVYFPALFGYSNSQWKWFYPNNQIFPASEFQGVLDALNAKRARGQPMIVNCQHSVIENEFWGVQARSGRMWVTWCYLDRCADWESALGSSTIRKQIEQGNPVTGKPTGPFQNFPNYLTVEQNPDCLVQLTSEQVTLLADFACDCILIDDENSLSEAVARAVGQ